jgi:mono/diheme cytochrome c family protein
MKLIQRSLQILCLLPVLLAACAPASAPLPGAMTAEPSTVPPPASAEPTGATLYQFSCAACHGKDRAGSTFELAGQTIKVPGLNWDNLNRSFQADPSRGSVPEQVALAITTGQDAGGGELNAMMPRWSFLSQPQVDSLVQYLQTTFK